MNTVERVVLITGGSSGIGKAAARMLLESASTTAIAVCGRDTTRLESLLSEWAPDPARFLAIPADVTRPDEVTRMVDRVLERFERIDALVNSAGAGYLGPFTETSLEAMDRLWNVNVRGAMIVTQAVLPGMLARKSGSILNLCGILGVKTIANAALYCATKHALVGFGSALAQELKRSQIRITNLCCSGVDTPFWDEVPGKPRPELLLKPEEVATEIVRILDQPAHVATTTVLLQHVAHQM